MSSDTPLWSPSRQQVDAAAITQFIAAANKRFGLALTDYDDLHRWSVERREDFWTLVWDEFGVIGDRGGVAIENGDAMPGARFFPEARLNFAENLLRKTGSGDAIVFRGEDKVERRLSWDELRSLVSRLRAW